MRASIKRCQPGDILCGQPKDVNFRPTAQKCPPAQGSFHGLDAEQLPPGDTASTSLCTAGAGISSSCVFGCLICSIVASCCVFQSSGAVPPLRMKSSAAEPTAPSADKSCELAATSLTRKDRRASGCSLASLSRQAVSCARNRASASPRSEDPTSQLQSHLNLVC